MAAVVLRVGVIGAGEVAQVIHLPNLQLMNHLYTVSAICDVSQKTVDFCKKRYNIPLATTNPDDVIEHPDIDVIFNLTSDEFHEIIAVAALKAGKHVMQEKPISLSVESTMRIVQAEKEAKNGARVFVGYMRRYAPSFVGAFKREVASIDRVLYARSRGIVGPNAYFVNQSGTFPFKNLNDIPSGASAKRENLLSELLSEAFDGNKAAEEDVKFWRHLGSLGSHDLSLMREVLGVPQSVAGVSVNPPFYSAILNYSTNRGAFSVTYETGIDEVVRFDSHLTVYGKNKTVSIHYDTPYVKGLAIRVKVDEVNADDEVVSREILSSYEDAYTTELKEMHACFTEGREIKTTAEDALQDAKFFAMLFEQHRQQRMQNLVLK